MLPKSSSVRLAICVAIILPLLAACGGGNDHKVTATSAPHVQKAKPIQVYREVGLQQGVVRHGTAADRSFIGTGYTYTCAAGLRTITLPYLQTVDYNGMLLSFDQPGPYKDRSIDDIYLRFGGQVDRFANRVASVIVMTENEYVGKTNDAIADDDQVVNMTPDRVRRGIVLNPLDFTSTTIDGLKVCLRPPSPPSPSS